MARIAEDPNAVRIRVWLAAGMARTGCNAQELSRRTGIPLRTLSKRKKEPGTMLEFERWAIERVLGRMEEYEKEDLLS